MTWPAVQFAFVAGLSGGLGFGLGWLIVEAIERWRR